MLRAEKCRNARAGTCTHTRSAATKESVGGEPTVLQLTCQCGATDVRAAGATERCGDIFAALLCVNRDTAANLRNAATGGSHRIYTTLALPWRAAGCAERSDWLGVF